MRPVSRLAVGVLVALALGAAALASASEYSLVRVWFDGADQAAFLKAHPELDVATVNPGHFADVVATPATRDVLRRSGLRLEILHEDLVAFYASRIESKVTNFGGWHTYSENIAYLDSLRTEYPDRISAKWSIGQTHQLRDLWCVRLSDNPDVDEAGEPEILLDTMHHAREIMSGDFGLMFADYLCSNYGSDPVVTWLLDNRELYLVSIVNPDGVVYNEQTDPNGGGMWRKNRRNNGDGSYGVDLNRNYTYQWNGSGSSPYPEDDTYRGPYAGSEPEIQALMSFINGRQFVTQQALHTDHNAALFPWGYTTTPCPDRLMYDHMAMVMTAYNGYVAGTAPEILYIVNGGANDWAYGAQTEHAKIFSFCNEMGTTGFWPSFAERDGLFQDNLWPMLYLMMAAGGFPQVIHPVTTDGSGGIVEPGENGFFGCQVVNQGVTEAITNVRVTLRCDDPYVQFANVVCDIQSLAPTADVAIEPPFAFTVDPACPEGHLVGVTVTVEFTGGTIDYPLTFMVGAPSQVFFDSFSAGTGNWTFSGGQWGLTGTAHTAPYALTDSPSGSYGNNWNATATINGTYQASRLLFWHRYSLEEGYDYGRVQVSPNGGGWQTLASYDGTHTSWEQVDLDLSQFAGQNLSVRFQVQTDVYVTDDGWYLDDVQLLGNASSNGVPPRPAPVAPADGAVIDGPVVLTVANVADPEGGPVTYGFRIYSDILLTQLVAEVDGVAAGAGGQTSWTAPALGLGTYYWRAYAADAVERGLLGETRSFSVGTTTGVDGVVVGPRLLVLGQGSGRAELQLSLGQVGDVTVKIYNARGHLVRDLFAGRLEAGSRRLVWDGRDGQGRQVASGVYFVRAVAGATTLHGRVTMVR